MRGCDLLVRTLVGAGVEKIFTLSGNQIMPVFDACIDAGIELVHVRHEAAAVHMADAWGRLTGTAGVALLTAGPGHANGVAALYTALASESPLLLLSGHAPVAQLGKGAFQEMAQADMAAPVCKAARLVTVLQGLSADIAAALHTAQSGRPGPVHLSVPFDILETKTTHADIASPVPQNSVPAFEASAAAAIRAYLQDAARPLILTGPALMRDPGRAILDALSRTSGVPVIGMESPRGVNDPALGRLAEVLARADLVLLLAKPLDFSLRFGASLAEDCVLLQVDPDPAMLLRARRNLGAPARFLLGIQADGADCAQAVLAAYQRTNTNTDTDNQGNDWFDEVQAAIAFRPPEWETLRAADQSGLHPAELCRALQPFIERSKQAVLVADGGEFGQWAQACLTAPVRMINGPAGAIGSALPFAAAARMACPDADIFALLGDGTFGFHMAEIDTAVRYGLPYLAVIGNDARWNAEHQIQLQKYGAERLSGCELLPTRYDLAAQALGAHGEYVTEPAQLPPAVQRALASRLPACINVKLESHRAPII